jgi:type VI secretion system protein ImpG
MFNKYYQDELLFLRQLGEEFSRAHPAAAHFLGQTGSDPDVERLLEGFAFLSGRIRQKLDDELPEITHSMLGMLWPHYLRPVPALAVLEFSPVLAALRQSQHIPRGVEVQSIPVEGTPCRFRTTSDVHLNPVSLDGVTLESQASGPSRLLLDFRVWNQARVDTLDLRRVRLFLHGDPAVSTTLYHNLCRHVREATVFVPGASGETQAAGPRLPVTFEPAGFAENDALLPYPARSASAYRLIQEYFSLPEKFLFMEVIGLEKIGSLPVQDRFRVEVRFDRALPANLRPTREEIRLYCTPITNLFAHEADPFRIDRTQAEYRLRPSGSNPLHYEIFSVDRVTGLLPGTSQERVIPDFYSFRHGGGSGDSTHYTDRVRASVVDDRSEHYLSFVDVRGIGAIPPVETIAVSLTATNRRLPEGLRVGDVSVPTDSSPEFVKFKNLTVPTPSVAPPLGGDLLWRLISHLSLNYISLTSVEALRGILELYNFQAMRDPRAARANAMRINGIERLRSRPAVVLVRGAPVRGWEVELDLLEDHYAGDGDLYLFASLVNEFLSLHTTINSFTRLRTRGTQRGEEITWPSKIGQKTLI